mgnify:CR=1 FL=1
MMPSSGGRFEVMRDGKPVFQKSKVGRHAQPPVHAAVHVEGDVLVLCLLDEVPQDERRDPGVGVGDDECALVRGVRGVDGGGGTAGAHHARDARSDDVPDSEQLRRDFRSDGSRCERRTEGLFRNVFPGAERGHRPRVREGWRRLAAGLVLLTGAALATINRLPVLLLPGDVFASRAPDPVLQQVEHFGNGFVIATL